MSAVLATLRLARRDALRHRWRSLLIVALILAPVAAATGIDVLYRTSTSTERLEEGSLGAADGELYAGSADARPSSFTAELALAALPPGSRVVPLPATYDAAFSSPGRAAAGQVVVTEAMGDPLVRDHAQLVSGTAPAAMDEAAVSRSLADRLGLLAGDELRDGAVLTLRDGPSARLTGLIRDPFCFDCDLALALPGSDFAAAAAGDAVYREDFPSFRVDLPAGADATAVAAALPDNQLGLSLRIRDSAEFELLTLSNLRNASPEALRAAALVTLIAGLGLLEVVLLAGTAFAVGARRQVRDLGMLAVQGGSPRDLRRVVLAQGLLLGAVGAVAGVVVGAVAVVALKPVWENAQGEIIVGWHYGLAEIAIAAGIGVVSGVAAALIPALSAGRRSPVAALAARFPRPTAASRVAPWIGAGLVLVGGSLGLLASSLMSGGFDAATQRALGYSPVDFYAAGAGRLDSTSGALLILVGVFIAVAGLLLLAPAILAGIARASGRLGWTARMAARDGARHRHRTGPATVAIAVAVGGAVAISCLLASDRGEERLFPAAPDRVLGLSIQGAAVPAEIEPAAAAAARLLPDARVLTVSGLYAELSPQGGDLPLTLNTTPCRALRASDVPTAGARAAACSLTGGVIGVADADAVVLASGRVADRGAVAAALNAGKAVLLNDEGVTAETTVFLSGGLDGANVELPAISVPRTAPYEGLPAAFVSAELARTQQWLTRVDTVLVDHTRASAIGVEAATAAIERLGIPVFTSAAERESDRALRLGLTAAAALIGLIGVSMCIALSAAEGRPDLATLAAVGAPPTRRRRLAAAQALLLAGAGTVLGLVFGFYFAYAARPATGAVSTVVPWGDLAITVLAVPLLAVLVAAAGSMGRLPLTRRAD